jgi:hypothetical protein
MGALPYRLLPRGVPPIGFVVETGALEITPLPGRVRCAEPRIGELEVAVFAAALIIDRDGILAAKASEAARGAVPMPIELPGASGYRAEAIVLDAPLRYLLVFALAHDDAIDGGVLVTVRSAQPELPAADELLASLRILSASSSAGRRDY